VDCGERAHAQHGQAGCGETARGRCGLGVSVARAQATTVFVAWAKLDGYLPEDLLGALMGRGYKINQTEQPKSLIL
jgi:hypothetical protein